MSIRSYLSQASVIALAHAVFLTASVQAQDVAVTVHLAAQPLGQALNALALQTDTRIIFSSALTEGRNSPAVNGSMTVQQALDQLLSGSGLTASMEDRDIYIRQRSTERSDDDPTATLSTITVAGTWMPTTAEEAASNYTVSRSSNATKLDLSIKETPQSLTIITEKQIEEQNLQQVVDVLRNTPGLSIQEYGVPGAGRASVYSRGYAINNYQIDGMPTSASMFGGADMMMSMDTSIYERIEIIRGSTGLTTGAGDPSASINFVRKRPHFEPAYKASLSYGTWARRRAELDLSQPFNASGSLRGRLVATAQEGRHWVDRVEEKTRMFYGIVEADLGEDTTLALSHTRFGKRVDDAAPHGTDLRGNTDSTYTMLSEGGRHFNAATQWSWAKQDVKQYMAELKHHFNDDWSLSGSYQYTDAEPNRVYGMVGFTYYDPKYQLASLDYGRIHSRNKLHNLDITLLGKFQLWQRDAQVAVGFNGHKGEIDSPQYWNSNVVGSSIDPITKDSWNNGAIPIPYLPRGTFHDGTYAIDQWANRQINTETQRGAFLSLKLKPFEDTTLILGTRYHDYNLLIQTATKSGVPSGIPDAQIKHPRRFIPYFGVIQDLTESTALYASYTNIYQPQSDVQGVTSDELDKGLMFVMMPPKTGNTYEIGFKTALNDDRLNLHGALFRMHEKNVPYNYYYYYDDKTQKMVALTCRSPYKYQQQCDPMAAMSGPTMSGMELTIAGEITPRWRINAGYTYLHVGAVSAPNNHQPGDDVAQGNDFNRPKHTVVLFSTYDLTDKLTLGGGIRWKSPTIAVMKSIDNYEQPSYAVVDLMARYRFNQHTTLGLNVGNLFDKTYMANERASYFGSPRSVTASLNMQF